jgi:hypothetical protein
MTATLTGFKESIDQEWELSAHWECKECRVRSSHMLS